MDPAPETCPDDGGTCGAAAEWTPPFSAERHGRARDAGGAPRRTERVGYKMPVRRKAWIVFTANEAVTGRVGITTGVFLREDPANAAIVGEVIRTAAIDSGDIHICAEGVEHPILIIEVKRDDDARASIGGRFKSQEYFFDDILRHCPYIYFIVGNFPPALHGVSNASAIAQIGAHAARDGVGSVVAPTESDLAVFLLNFWDWVRRADPEKLVPHTRDPGRCLPHMQPKGKRGDIDGLYRATLQSVPGISPPLASAVMAVFPVFADLVTAVRTRGAAAAVGDVRYAPKETEPDVTRPIPKPVVATLHHFLVGQPPDEPPRPGRKRVRAVVPDADVDDIED